VARQTGQPLVIVLKRVKGKYDSGVKGELGEINRWYDVELRLTRYVDVCRESYRWMAGAEGKRKCKSAHEKEEEVEDGIGPLV